MKYFTMSELTRSATAKRYGINNDPPGAAKESLQALVDTILDPLRAAWGKPIVVNSGYRCPRLNNIVGGARNSQHTSGEAVDIECISRDRAENKRLFQLIRTLNLPFDQLINEYDYDWIHVSYVPRGRHRVLEAKRINGRVTYIDITNEPGKV